MYCIGMCNNVVQVYLISLIKVNFINQYMLILPSCVNLLDSQVLSTKNDDIQAYPSKFLIFGSTNTWPVVVYFDGM